MDAPAARVVGPDQRASRALGSVRPRLVASSAPPCTCVAQAAPLIALPQGLDAGHGRAPCAAVVKVKIESEADLESTRASSPGRSCSWATRASCQGPREAALHALHRRRSWPSSRASRSPRGAALPSTASGGRGGCACSAVLRALLRRREGPGHRRAQPDATRRRGPRGPRRLAGVKGENPGVPALVMARRALQPPGPPRRPRDGRGARGRRARAFPRRRPDGLQHGRRDPGHGQARRGGDAGRAPRLLARRHRRHRQRGRVAVAMEAMRILQALGRQAEADHPRRASGRARSRGCSARAPTCASTSRRGRTAGSRASATCPRSCAAPDGPVTPQARPREALRLLQPRQRHRQDPRHLRRAATRPRRRSSRPGCGRCATWAPPRSRIRSTGGTDHLPFDGVGLPGFQFIQDQADYSTRTHHTNLDVYDRCRRTT